MADSCGNTNKNPNVPCEQLDGQIKKVLLMSDAATFADQAAFTEAAFDAFVQSGDIIPMPKHLTMEGQGSGVVYEQTSLGEANVSNGTVSWLFGITANTELYKKIYSFRGSTSWNVGLVTASGKIKLLKNTALSGFGVEVLNVENMLDNDGSVSEKAPLKITLDDNESYNSMAVVFKPSFSILRKKALSDVVIEVLTESATTITFKVNKASDNDAVQAANPVYGLDIVDFTNDFTLVDETGAAQTVSGISGGTVAASGVYTATGTAFVTGELNLKDPSLMTSKGYSSTGAAAITIP